MATKRAVATKRALKKANSADTPTDPDMAQPSTDDTPDTPSAPNDPQPSTPDTPSAPTDPDVATDEDQPAREVADPGEDPADVDIPTQHATVAPPAPAVRVHTLTARAKAHLRAIVVPHVKADVVDANMSRIVEHVESGRCAVVLSNPPGVDLICEMQADVDRNELKRRYGARLRFDILTSLRKAQVL